jgi:predicted ArsR family transcriptional regulator
MSPKTTKAPKTAEPASSKDAAPPVAQSAAEPAARRRVLDLLSASRHPLDARAVGEALDIHVTTARFHLEQLEEAGLLRRSTAREQRPGRPRIVYALSASLRAADARERLIEVLANALADRQEDGHAEAAPDDGRADAATASSAGTALTAPARGSRRPWRPAALRAGQRWADATPLPPEADPVDELVDALDSLGFQPELSGEEILMRECPFRAAARGRPDVVCAVHQGFVERMLERAAEPEHPDRPARLLPFVEPELCVVQLGRSA